MTALPLLLAASALLFPSNMEQQMFCQMRPSECPSSHVEEIVYSERVYSDVARINSFVNLAVSPGAGGHYTPAWLYVQRKRQALVEEGYSPAAMVAVIKETPLGRSLVLHVHTTEGILILDHESRKMRVKW